MEDLPILCSVVRAYQAPEGPQREKAIRTAMRSSSERQVVAQWLNEHENEVASSPILQDVKARVVRSIKMPAPQVGPSFSLVSTAVAYASKAYKIITGSRQPSDIESAIISGNLKTIEGFLKNNPEELIKSSGLLKTHLSIGTLSFADLLPILQAVAETLMKVELPFFPQVEVTEANQRPSLFRMFNEEIRNFIAIPVSDAAVKELSSLAKQDRISADPYLSDIDSLLSYMDKNISLNVQAFLPLLKELPFDQLEKIATTKNADGDTLLHQPERLKAFLPALLEQMSTQELQRVLSETNQTGLKLWNVITDEMIGALTKSQCLRLCAVWQAAKPEDRPQDLKDRLPDFAQNYLNIISSENPQVVIQDLKEQLPTLDQEEQAAALGFYIEYRRIPLRNLQGILSKEDFLRLGPYLRYVDLRDFADVDLAKKLLRNCPVLNELSINNGKMLDDVRELPRCEFLDCSYCTSLTRLPEVPQCRKLNCYGCGLTSLKLPRCEFLDCSGCTSLTRLEVPQCRQLDCSGCTGLTRLELPQCISLNCRGCTGLTRLEVPQCRQLDCNDCTGLTRLELPQCISLNCTRCTGLTHLEVPRCVFLDCSLCTGLIRLELPLCKKLISTGCTGLTSLELPLCKNLICIGCTGLTSLELPRCKNLNCNHCISLTRLELPRCVFLDCWGCYGLTRLPEVPQCIRLDCRDCTGLTYLPVLPRCTFLNYSNCPRIRELPELPFNAHVVSESSVPFQQLNVNIEQFSTDPIALLLLLGKHLLNGRPFPNVCYFEKGLPSVAIDAGGVRRDFVTRLCENLFKKDFNKDERGKFLHLRGGLAPEATKDIDTDELAYRTLGVIFALCSAGGSNFKTGPLFHESVYEYFCSPGDPESDEWFLNALLRKSQLSSPDSIAEAFIHPNVEMPQIGKKDLDRLAVLLDQDPSKCTQNYFADNQEEITRNLVDLAKEDKSLLAVSWMAKMMKSNLGNQVWTAFIAQGAKAIQDSVEGIISADALKAKLEWEPAPNLPIGKLERTKAYLNTWIDHSSIDQLSLFVRAVTGNKTLCAANLNIDVYNRGDKFIPKAHTCSYALEMSGDYKTQEQFDANLNWLLTEGMAGSGFTME